MLKDHNFPHFLAPFPNGNTQANSQKQMRGFWHSDRFQRIVNLIVSKSHHGPIHLCIYEGTFLILIIPVQCHSLIYILLLEMFFQISCCLLSYLYDEPSYELVKSQCWLDNISFNHRHPLMYFYESSSCCHTVSLLSWHITTVKK